MPDLNDYIEEAMERQNLRSYNALHRHLGFKGTALHFWRKGLALPSESSMIKLAIAAGRDPKQGLLDLGQWKAARDGAPEVAKHYEAIAKTLRKVTATVLAAGLAGALTYSLHSPAEAKTSVGPDRQVYIMRVSGAHYARFLKGAGKA